MVLKQPVIQSTSTSSAQALSKYEPVEAIERSASNGLRQAQSDFCYLLLTIYYCLFGE